MKTLVSNKEIEEVGESLMLKYLLGKKPPLRCIDIEDFITDFLHLPIVYTTIAEEDRDKIGFISDGIYPLQVMREGRREKVIYPKGTIVIDRFFLQPDKSAQRRFTLAHEAAHVIFERMSPTAQNMADRMGVSFTALLIRLRELRFVEYRSISEYLESEMSF